MEKIVQHFKLPLENPVLIFSLILIIILLAPILLRKIKIPGITVLIISGMFIGPHGLHLLDKSLFVDVFSTIGLLYIMFIAGLELELHEFWGNRNKSYVFGAFTFFIPIMIGFPVCYFLLGYNFYASLLTASMFATHTMVTYPIVSRFGLSKNQAVAVTVGGTILTDTAVLLLLAVILGAHQGNLTAGFWLWLVFSLGLFLSVMFWVVPRIARWFFDTLPSDKYSHFIFVLTVVFVAAFMAEVSGVEAIIGAFVAGLALNKLIPHSSVLMNRIEFIGNALFIPFFLISVGMLVDITVLFQGPAALMVAGTLTVVAVSGKWLASYFTKLVLKYTTTQQQLMFGLSNSHAAATLAVILVGFRENILDANILNGTIVLILITCILASFITERAAKKAVLIAENEISSKTPQTGQNEQILLTFVNTKNMDKALEFALLIKEKKSINPISIVTIVHNDEEAERNMAMAKSKLQQFIYDSTGNETNAKVWATIDLNVWSGIARTAREIMADIIILGWPKKSGFIEKLIGEKIQLILSQTKKSAFICHFEKPLPHHKKIWIALPLFAEHETGFSLWMSKIAALSQALGIPIEFSCNQESKEAIVQWLTIRNMNLAYQFHIFKHPDQFYALSATQEKDTFYVVIAARPNAVSYLNSMDKLPQKMETTFSDTSRILIYP